jgi:hypothetical protein
MSESGVPVIRHSVPPDDARSILANVAPIVVDKVGIFGAYHLALVRGTNPDSFRGTTRASRGPTSRVVYR